MYRSGFYWNFLGFSQVLAGILILIPATATLGAVAFFPIILNVTVITISVGFKGDDIHHGDDVDCIVVSAMLGLGSLALDSIRTHRAAQGAASSDAYDRKYWLRGGNSCGAGDILCDARFGAEECGVADAGAGSGGSCSGVGGLGADGGAFLNKLMVHGCGDQHTIRRDIIGDQCIAAGPGTSCRRFAP